MMRQLTQSKNGNSCTLHRVVLAVVLGLCAFGSPITPAAAQDAAWVLTTDFGTFGRIRQFGMDSSWSMSGDVATIPGDPAARHHDDFVYVVGRSVSNSIQVYDPSAGFALVREFSLGAGLNPQDIAFDDQGDAYVSCYDQAVLLRVDVEAETVLETFDTSIFADADGLPETAWMQLLGDRLYITCQKLDRGYYYSPTGPGALLVFDTIAEQWVDMDDQATGTQPIALQGGNPYTRLEVFRDGAGGPFLRVGCAGYYGVQDGGLERIDPEAGLSLGYDVTETSLGGDIIGYTGSGPGSVHVLISDSSFHTSLRHVNLNTDQVTVLHSSNAYVHADIAYDGGFQLYLAERTPGASGVRVFDTVSAAELTSSVIPTGLPPFQFVMPFNGGFTPVPGPLPAIGQVQMAAPYPNPCNPQSSVDISGAPGHRVRIQVVDLRGRRVQEAMVTLDADGSGQFHFDGRGRNGESVAAGVYRITAEGSGGFAARSVTLIK
jgi:FlgD Ig-like domain